jgi:hypothetical protein
MRSKHPELDCPLRSRYGSNYAKSAMKNVKARAAGAIRAVTKP